MAELLHQVRKRTLLIYYCEENLLAVFQVKWQMEFPQVTCPFDGSLLRFNRSPVILTAPFYCSLVTCHFVTSLLTSSLKGPGVGRHPKPVGIFVTLLTNSSSNLTDQLTINSPQYGRLYVTVFCAVPTTTAVIAGHYFLYILYYLQSIFQFTCSTCITVEFCLYKM